MESPFAEHGPTLPTTLTPTVQQSGVLVDTRNPNRLDVRFGAMQGSLVDSLYELTVADVMLATPKTLPSDTTVLEAREALGRENVQMLLLSDGPVFCGAVTSIPDDADPASLVLPYANSAAETIAPTDSAKVAYERTRLSPHRRVVVLDSRGLLLGLVCLNSTLTQFCTGDPNVPC